MNKFAPAPTVVLRPGRRTFDVEVAGKRSEYEVVSEWEGMLKLQGDDGILIVSRKDNGTFSAFFRDALGVSATDGELVIVVMASPCILGALAPEVAK